MNVLGFMNIASHDAGACIVSDNFDELKYIAISDERLSRVKRSYFHPLRAIKYCMEHLGIKNLGDIDYIYHDYGIDKRINNTTKRYRKLEADYIRTKFKYDFNKVKYIDHHLAHAASSFYPSHFDDAAILVVDGFGSNAETNSLYIGDYHNGIEIVEKSYGFGIGMIYVLVTRDILNFAAGEEGKTMGLAALGKDIVGKNILNLNPTFRGLITDYSEFVERAPNYGIKQNIKKCEDPNDIGNEYFSKIAYEIQEEAERAVLHLVNHAYRVTKKKKLCLAGGVALNCVANSKILENSPFEEVFIQPAASDTGIPLGLALCGYYEQTKKKKKISYSVFTGIEYEKKDIKKLLESKDIEFKEVGLREVAECISQNNIVGWFTGGSEYGPRALGHRSILADPRYLKTKEQINAKVKHREMFRPFAPSILYEEKDKYFDIKVPSPYMLLAPHAKYDALNKIPAVIHLDGTGRVHTVKREENPQFYSLIEHFKEHVGIPVLLNTSFNRRGEPIVESPLDAIISFLSTDIDYLYLEGIFIDKKKIKNIEELIRQLEGDRKKITKFDYKVAVNRFCDSYSTEEMKNYLKLNYHMHRYYTDQHCLVNLQDNIHQKIKQYRYFVTDNYHKKIIEEIMPEEKYIIDKYCRHIIIEDYFKNLNQIPNHSFIVLYDLSIYIMDKTSFNFYDKESKKIKDPYKPVKDVIDFNLSNEYNSNNDWDKFFNEHIF